MFHLFFKEFVESDTIKAPEKKTLPVERKKLHLKL
jgi:hypothetical protein